MPLIPPQYLDAVVAIGYEDKFTEGAATGFLYGQYRGQSEEPGYINYVVYLVTCKHVIEKDNGKFRSEIFLRFNTQGNEPARYFPMDLNKEDEFRWWRTPTRKDVDIAVCPINTDLLMEAGINLKFFASDKHIMPLGSALSQGLSEGDGVFILGFPRGDIGLGRNYVIVRHGVIARVSDFPINQSSSFLIDAHVFPGNSGGPVVNEPTIMTFGKGQPIKRAYVVGVVAGYDAYTDELRSNQTGRTVMRTYENSGIARVVPMDYVVTLIEKYDKELSEQALMQSPQNPQVTTHDSES